MTRSYKIPITLTFTGEVHINAGNKKEAEQIARESFSGILDTCGDYGNDERVRNWNVSTHSEGTLIRRTKTPQQHYKTCVKIYEKEGAIGVYRYASKHRIGIWQHCEPCDVSTPHLPESKRHGGTFCLVCGTHHK